MIDALILRFDAPLMSFGAVVVDNLGVTGAFPGRSMLTGLIGNALGYRHGDATQLNNLQSRIRYAARCDRPGIPLIDYQTADLSQTFLGEGWTTRGYREGREGGTASEGTTIRYRHYIANALYTVALTLDPAAASPTLEEIAIALASPTRPLFLGRKTCLPSGPILLEARTGNTLREILRAIPPIQDRGQPPPWPAIWPPNDGADLPTSRLVPVYDDRDWANQIHAGRRWMREGVLDG